MAAEPELLATEVTAMVLALMLLGSRWCWCSLSVPVLGPRSLFATQRG
ncbi:MAG: hypothetical protein IPM35_33615 [Myxococcales bacterium]|nr:hypothetical protein [Myxococcales bacterium]